MRVNNPNQNSRRLSRKKHLKWYNKAFSHKKSSSPKDKNMWRTPFFTSLEHGYIHSIAHYQNYFNSNIDNRRKSPWLDCAKRGSEIQPKQVPTHRNTYTRTISFNFCKCDSWQNRVQVHVQFAVKSKGITGEALDSFYCRMLSTRIC